jgi:hypothetical protein
MQHLFASHYKPTTYAFAIKCTPSASYASMHDPKPLTPACGDVWSVYEEVAKWRSGFQAIGYA